ncbi:MAG: hypothetical protein KGI33_00255 [Thaumarchaeota archaeon]|nr:hypothetical protein [Nitrososphaerota archaeon]
MNSKILLGGVVALFAIFVMVFAFLPTSGVMKSLVPAGTVVPTSLTAVSTEIKPITVLYNGTSITNSSYTDAQLRTAFYVVNPNDATLILEAIDYKIYADGVMVGHGSIGQRFQGSWDSSYYYPLIAGSAQTISGTANLKNTGNYPTVWSALEKNTAKISISGSVYYATKTAFSGHDYAQTFNFTNP